MPIYRTLLALLVLPLLLSACVAGESLQQAIGQSTQTYPPVTEWICPPGGAQLVLDARGKSALGSFSLEGAAVARIDSPTALIYSRAVRSKKFGSWDSVVLFTNLEPGVYKIHHIRLERANAWLSAPLPDADEFTVTLAANELKYLGQIVYEEKPGFPARRTVGVVLNSERRSEAFAILKDRFQTSPCNLMLEK